MVKEVLIGTLLTLIVELYVLSLWILLVSS